MIRRLAVITAWLLAGHALWLGLFWGLLQVPESSTAMIVLSAALIVLLVALGAALHGGAAAAWDATRDPWGRLLAGVHLVPAVLLASAVFGAAWWVTDVALDWHTRTAGQIDAAYIARTGRSATGWIHGVIFWTVMFVRWTLGLTLAVSLLGAVAGTGLRAVASTRWIRAGVAPRRWLALTFWLVLLVALPWQAVDWRPARIGLALEPWFVAAKLAAVAVAMAAGWALVLRVGTDEPREPDTAGAAIRG